MSFNLINPYFFPAVAPPFSPTDIAGLQIWVKGDTGLNTSGGTIYRWSDQSGNANDLTQFANTSYRPTDGGSGKVTFDGTDDFLTATTTVTVGHIFIVCTPSGTQSYGSMCSFASNHFLIRDATTNAMYFNAGVSIFGASCSTNMRVNQASSTTLGTTKKQFNTKGTPVSSKRLIAGKDINGGAPASGDIYEIIVYDSSLSDTDRNNVETYLKDKYGL